MTRGRPRQPRLEPGTPVVVREGGAVVYRSRVRRTGWTLPAGQRGRVTERVGGRFVLVATGAGGPYCSLGFDPARCRATHVHTLLLRETELEPACPALAPFGDADGLVPCLEPPGHEPPHRNLARHRVWRDAPRRGTHVRSRGRLVKIPG